MKETDSLIESEGMIKFEASQNLEQYLCARMLWSWGRIMDKEKVLQILVVLENIYSCIKTKAQDSVANALQKENSVKKMTSLSRRKK